VSPEQQRDGPVTVTVVSDFVCPWCYVGLAELEQLAGVYTFERRHAPYLLDPSTPPEGKPRRPMTRPEDPPTELELRAEGLGVRFNRGRTMMSNSLLAHEGTEFAYETAPELAPAYVRRMFRAYFEELRDIGDPAVVLLAAGEVGLDVGALADALVRRTYQQQVADGVDWARESGVTGVPTFIFDDRMGIVGAQDQTVFRAVMERLGAPKRSHPDAQ